VFWGSVAGHTLSILILVEMWGISANRERRFLTRLGKTLKLNNWTFPSGTRFDSAGYNPMNSSIHSAGRRLVEVGNIDRHGLWLFVDDKEYFVPLDSFPWFRNATIGQIINVDLLDGDRLHWPDLDLDLSLESLANPEPSPLVLK
jgi:hypothetical protein